MPPTLRRQPRKTASLSLGDRFASAFVGVVFGALIGFALAWLMGVYSQRAGSGSVSEGLMHLVGSTSLVFGCLGFILGPSVGTLIGEFIDGLFAFEGAYDERGSQVPWRTVLVVLLGVPVLVWLVFG